MLNAIFKVYCCSRNKTSIYQGNSHYLLDPWLSLLILRRVWLWIAVNGWWEWIPTFDKTTKNPLMSRKNGLPGTSLVSTLLALGKVRFSLISDNTLGCDLRAWSFCLISPASCQGWDKYLDIWYKRATFVQNIKFFHFFFKKIPEIWFFRFSLFFHKVFKTQH